MEKTLVYVGVRNWGATDARPKKVHVYLDVTGRQVGAPLEGVHLEQLGFPNLFGGAGLVGEMIRVEGEEGTYRLVERVGAWTNKDDLVGWQFLDRSTQAALAAAAAATRPLREDLVKTTLTPLRNAYRAAKPGQRVAMLAQIIAFVAEEVRK